MAAAGSERLELPAGERAASMVRALTYLVLVGVVAGFYWAYAEQFYKGLGYPRDTFLFDPGAHFSDLTSFYGLLKNDNPYYTASVYPPFAFIMMEPFALLGGRAAVVLWLAVVVCGLGAFVAWELDFMPRIERAAAVVVLTVVTYPFLFAFDRGNVEVFVTLLLAAFVWGLQTGRSTLAAVAIGVAAALKLYPVIFAALFLVRRQWRALGVTVATAAILTFLGSVYYDFNLPYALSLLREDLPRYKEAYVIGSGGLAYGCSLFGALKLLVFGLGGRTPAVEQMLAIYNYVVLALGLSVLVALWRLPLRFWEQVMLLTVALDVFPTVSGDYKLLHLVVPMVLFLRFGTDDPLRWWYLVGFATLMVPKAYLYLHGGLYPDNLGVGMDPLVMIAMALAIVVSASRRRRDGQLVPAPGPTLEASASLES